jgi:hypothetical protein
MLNQVGSNERSVKGVNKIREGQNVPTNLLFSDIIISSLTFTAILGMNSSALDHIQIV